MSNQKSDLDRLVAYYRYSAGSKQTEQSIEGQRRDCEAWAASHGMKISEEYVDRHISGKTDERDAFQRMISDSDRHLFSAVICWKTDRISRNRYDSAIYKNRLKKNGVRILYAAENIPEGPDGIILESLMEGLAEYYSAELSQKPHRGRRESALKYHALGGNYSLGLTSNKNHEFVIVEEEADTVRWIFEQYAAGRLASQIIQDLNAMGKTTSHGNAFNKMSITRIIQNEQYIGVYSFNGFRKEGVIPAIIDSELWDAAQQQMILNKNRKAPYSTRADYILSGKLFCGNCQTAMRGSCGTGKSGVKHYYYACPNHKSCKKKNIPKDFLENLVFEETARFISSPGRLDQIADRMIEVQLADKAKALPEKNLLETTLRENKKKQKNILGAIESGITTAGLTQRLYTLEQEETTIRYNMAVLEPPRSDFTKEQIVFMLSRFAQQDSETSSDYKHRLIETFVSSVYLTDTTCLITYNLTNKKSEPESSLLDLLHQQKSLETRTDAGFSGGSSDATCGDPYGNRTHVTAVKGPCLNRLTNGPQKHRISLKKSVYTITHYCGQHQLF